MINDHKMMNNRTCSYNILRLRVHEEGENPLQQHDHICERVGHELSGAIKAFGLSSRLAVDSRCLRVQDHFESR